MKRKLIFLDIDGTLVSGLSKPSPRVQEAVQGARAKGHGVFLSTGRNMPIIGHDIIEIGFDGMVASAGGHVEVNGKLLLDSLLPEDLVQECLSVFHANDIYCRIETPEGIYTDPQMEELLQTASPDPHNSELIRMQKELESGLVMQKYEDYPRKGAYKICFTSRNLQSIQETQKVLGDRFHYVVHPYGNSTTCLNGEIIPKGIDKGRGMELICSHLGMDLQDTIAFGDSMNDYTMMQHAGISIAMGNACDELKAVCDIICENVAQDGVYHEFIRMGLYEPIF